MLFFKKKTAYERDVCEWSSDVGASEGGGGEGGGRRKRRRGEEEAGYNIVSHSN